jgi:hypothetical protein
MAGVELLLRDRSRPRGTDTIDGGTGTDSCVNGETLTNRP